ncbi:MAG TPA: cytidine deaminase [Thermoanaerobaculia bacterium]|nr:cytidine deaminase [Thermoanaerobaculia bacterium]
MTRLTDTQLSEIRAALSGGFLPASALERFGQPVHELLPALIPLAQEYARPPISNFRVGTVALGLNGNVYFGANFEFTGQALSVTIHGEQAAVAHAIARGETGLRMIAISAAPCGFCRQFLNELSTAGELLIALPGEEPAPLAQFLPHAFGPSDLGVAAALMAPQSNGLTLDTNDALLRAALDAANASYSPYARSYAGVALQTRDGAIFTGALAENAAFNPSMSPLEAAVVNLVIRGGKSYDDITDAAMVEVENAQASQLDTTQAVLRSMTRVPLRVAYATA